MAMLAVKILFVAFAIALWALASRWGLLDPRLFPSPGDVGAVTLSLLARPDIRAELVTTLSSVFISLLISMPVGILLGASIASSNYWKEVMKPILFFPLSIPKSIFLPMFILVFGIGFQQKVAYAAFTTAFVVLMSATAAVESVRADHIMVARSYGATQGQILWRVYVPSMMPILLETLRISMIFNFTGVMIAEMYASRTGIGHLIANWGENFQMPQLFAGVIVLAAVAILFNETVRWLEARCSTWRT